jgi:cytochrome c biogenesis protein CcmG, thiol:disulfide interchange protein DsbE
MTAYRSRARRVISSFVMAAFVAAAGGAVPTAAERGRPAPDIRLHDSAGVDLKLSDLRGKVVVVDFWASWCAPCRKSFPALVDLQSLYGSKGLEVIAVNVDQQRRDAEAFLSAQPPGLRIVFDERGTTPKAFQVQAMPSSFVIGRDGTVRFVHVGFTDKVLDDFRREIAQLLDEPVGDAPPTR